MEKISIGKKKKLYEIKSIMPHSRTVLKIVFPKEGSIPDAWGGDIMLYTAGGIHCSTLSGYETVYLQEDKTVYLSNDGSVYVPPAPPEPVPEPARNRWSIMLMDSRAGITVPRICSRLFRQLCSTSAITRLTAIR